MRVREMISCKCGCHRNRVLLKEAVDMFEMTGILRLGGDFADKLDRFGNVCERGNRREGEGCDEAQHL